MAEHRSLPRTQKVPLLPCSLREAVSGETVTRTKETIPVHAQEPHPHLHTLPHEAAGRGSEASGMW